MKNDLISLKVYVTLSATLFFSLLISQGAFAAPLQKRVVIPNRASESIQVPRPCPRPIRGPRANVESGNTICQPSTPPPPPPPSDAYTGPYATQSAEYHLAPAIDNEVLAGVVTEVWGKVYQPTNFAQVGHKLPVIILLHGNHETCAITGSNPLVEASCDYTFSGSCPAGQTVIQNHLGYEYLATRLASWGNLVVSINANRGITCGDPVDGDWGLNLARGRLILRHLALLNKWNTVGGTPATLGVNLLGKLDFSQVGLFGHSRAGEGVRAAYNLYKDVGSTWPKEIGPMTVRAIFEIGPVDGQTARILDANGTAWNSLLPMCDGDVVQLQGMMPFDRMLKNTTETPALPKSNYAVWGANHNFYNTQWQTNDSPGCIGMDPIYTGSGSPANEQDTAIKSIIPFFRAHMGSNADVTLANQFNPSNLLPIDVSAISPVDRAYITANSNKFEMQMETFTNTNNNIGSSGQAHSISNLTLTHTEVPEHDVSLSAAEIKWTGAGAATFFQDNWLGSGAGLDVTGFATLDFRASRADNSSLNSQSYTDFGIRLVYADGSIGSEMRASNYLSLVGPVGTKDNLHPTLETVRIPLSLLNFNGSGKKVRGVRFVFDTTPSGDIFISDIDLSSVVDETQSAQSMAVGNNFEPIANLWSAFVQKLIPSQTTRVKNERASVIRGWRSPSTNQITGITRPSPRSRFMTVNIQSSDVFRARNALPILRLNGKIVSAGAFSHQGDMTILRFNVQATDVQQLPEQFSADIIYREDPQGEVRDLGAISKSQFPY